MIILELTHEDAAFLEEQLAIRRRAAENELIHTEKRQMQRDIARDVRRLEGILEHLVSRLDRDRSVPQAKPGTEGVGPELPGPDRRAEEAAGALLGDAERVGST